MDALELEFRMLFAELMEKNAKLEDRVEKLEEDLDEHRYNVALHNDEI